MSNLSKLAQGYTLENITFVRWLEDTIGVPAWSALVPGRTHGRTEKSVMSFYDLTRVKMITSQEL